jgi:crotonobetainyl-CoA:carnitine CoA-transferase CaiB-like acyl-CoA transferase
MKPLQGLLVLDFAQFLAGPSAAMRLADLGATVVKIERPQTGDICRQLYITNLELDGDSTLFHTINRNKRSYAADLKNPAHLAKVRALIARADVMIQNFRPGVMAKIGLDSSAVQALNPRLVYASVTGYGDEGPWVDLPGQDLLAQSRSGLTWLSGDADDGPVPMGLSVADMMAGAHLVQGILAALVQRGVSGRGATVDVSLMESVLDLQFEFLTTHLNDGGLLPQRSAVRNASAYLAAPYGIYATADGHLALAMGAIPRLGELLGCAALAEFVDPKSWFERRDEIKALLVEHLRHETNAHWLARLEAADYWCAPVMNWRELIAHDGFKALDFLQTVTRDNGSSLVTTRCPIRIDGQRLKAARGAPRVGEHNDAIEREFGL